ncbi:MAG: hypothetical protein PHF36_04815 [Candidatus Cloacimonetes bacterium]|nr:hypothetical protein [Candidatus Cloacimonadota bacterium]
MAYLYGAALQGIQSYIFSTNLLKEIVGASEIVEKICTEGFKKYVDGDNYEVIVSAAGNIKLKFENKKDMELLVQEFPKYVHREAPGITISQAVVEVEGDIKKKHFNKLEKLLKVQRNIISKPFVHSALGIKRDPRSRQSASNYDSSGGKQPFDLSRHIKDKNVNMKNLTKKLCKEGDDQKNIFPKDLSDITKSDDSSWLAVIHADGNSLGQIIQKLGDHAKDKLTEVFKRFSDELDKATCKSANVAFEKTIKSQNLSIHPMRPVIIGGDDLTIICRADLAIPFLKAYLTEFERLSGEFLKTMGNDYKIDLPEKITACAGIAYVKEKYPFHYAIDLAENLCSYAKQKSKEINKDTAPSSLMFHKVQAGFVESFDEIKKKELSAHSAGVDFTFGPYFLEDQTDYWSLDTFIKLKDKMVSQEKFPLSGLRKYLSELHFDGHSAENLWQRILQINGSFKDTLGKIKVNDNKKTPIYDLLSIISFEKNDTKEGGN